MPNTKELHSEHVHCVSVLTAACEILGEIKRVRKSENKLSTDSGFESLSGIMVKTKQQQACVR